MVQMTNALAEVFKTAAHSFLVIQSANDPESGAEHMLKAALAFSQEEKKAEKIIRELAYDKLKFDTLRDTVASYLNKEPDDTRFKALWKSIRDDLIDLNATDEKEFEKVKGAIENRTLELKDNGNIVDEIVDSYDLKETTRELIIGMFNDTTKIGGQCVGKGEYIMNLFVKNARMSSDVSIKEQEHEVKGVRAPVGQSPGNSRKLFGDLSILFKRAEGNFEYDYVKKTENPNGHPGAKKPFEKFYQFLNTVKDHSLKNEDVVSEALQVFSNFYTRDSVDPVLVKRYLESGQKEDLIQVFHDIGIRYLLTEFKEKNVVIFNAKGDYVKIPKDDIDKAFCFIGGEREKGTPIFCFPPASQDMRPEVQI